MKMKMICYKDNKLNIFTQPVFIDGSKSNEDIVEMTRRMCASGDMPSYYFEYDLYECGIFDDKVCSFEVKAPEFLVSLGDFRHLRPVEDVKKEEVKEHASC